MKTGEFTIPFEEGLHARPATELVKICETFKSEIQIKKDGMTINPKSILGIMALGAAKGDLINVAVDGEDEEEGFQKLSDFFSGK